MIDQTNGKHVEYKTIGRKTQRTNDVMVGAAGDTSP